MGAIRFLAAGGVLYVILRLRGAPAPTLAEWSASARVGVLLLTFGNGFVALAEERVSSGVAAVAVATVPIWVALFSSLGGQRPSRLEAAGLAVGFAGVALLRMGGGLGAAGAGAWIALLAPLSWAAGTVYSRKLKLPAGGMATAAQMIAGGVGMLLVGLVRGERIAAMPGARPALALAYLIVFGSMVGFSAYTFLLRATRPAVATSYAYVNPLVAVSLGIVIGGEQAGPMVWAAVAVILVGVLLISRARRAAPGAPERGAGRAPSPLPVRACGGSADRP